MYQIFNTLRQQLFNKVTTRAFKHTEIRQFYTLDTADLTLKWLFLETSYVRLKDSIFHPVEIDFSW